MRKAASTRIRSSVRRSCRWEAMRRFMGGAWLEGSKRHEAGAEGDQNAANSDLPGELLAQEQHREHDHEDNAELVDRSDPRSGTGLQRTVVAQPRQTGGDSR